MRIGLVTFLLCAGCFAVSDADQPTERAPEHQALLDAEVQPSNSPCQQTCTDGAECFWTKSGEQWQALCAESAEQANDWDLISTYAQECIVLGPDCGTDQGGEPRCDAPNHPSECIEDPDRSNRWRCYQSRGPCSDESMCRDEDNNPLSCVPSPQQAKHYNEAFQSRCMIPGASYDEAVGQGQIGLWISVNGQEICGLTTCDILTETSSCDAYTEGLTQLGNLFNAFAVCSGLVEAGEEALTCDWRECQEDAQCVRNYRVEDAQCHEGWCRLDNSQPHYLSMFAHGDGIPSDGPKGLPQCQYGDSNSGFGGCHDGEICTYADDRYTLDGCLECERQNDCPNGSDCLGGYCRFGCQSDDDCISGREQCSDGGYCVERHHHGGGGGGHPEFCHDLECQHGTNCAEITLWVEEQRRDVHRAVCLKDRCESTDECAAGTACLRGRCQFSGLCDDENQCGMVEQLGRECTRFVDDNETNQVLCLSPDDHCSEDHECPDDGADCYLGFCGQMRRDIDGCDSDNGRYRLSHLGYCPRRFNRCAERGDGWCGDGEYCHDAELRPPAGDFGIQGALCFEHDRNGVCNPNLALGTRGDACPLGSTCAQVDWGQGPQWRCLFENLCDPTARQPNCGPGRVCHRMITGDRYWCIDPNSLCGDRETCDNEETCVAGFCGAALASQCSVDQSVAVGTCVERELVLEHPFANDADQCAPGLRYTPLANTTCVDLRLPCENDGMCGERPPGMTSCIEGFCGVNAACNPSWGMSSFTGICEAQEPQCNPACEDDETCQRFEHPRWFEGVSFTDCNPRECGAAGFDPYCAYGQYCDSQSRCQFGGLCDNNQDCGEGFDCDSKNEVGHCFRQADQEGCNREGEFFGAGLCFVIATEVERCPTDDYQFRTGFCDRTR